MSLEIDGSTCAMLVKEKMGCLMDVDGTGENYRQNNLMSVYY